MSAVAFSVSAIRLTKGVLLPVTSAVIPTPLPVQRPVHADAKLVGMPCIRPRSPGLALGSARKKVACTRARRLHPVCASAAELMTETSVEPSEEGGGRGKGKRGRSKGSDDKAGASSIASGVRLENVKKTFKNLEVLKDVSWECKSGERVGLVGKNGSGKTTQLRIITGELEADSGSVILPKRAEVAYLTQEFEVVPTRTVREEFLTVFAKQVELNKALEQTEKDLGECVDDMDRMQELIDKLTKLQTKVDNTDMFDMDKSIDTIMASLGFTPEDNHRLVASFSGGWQMRMSLGKILLQKPDLLLLDEPTNHLDLDSVEWLENYLKEQTVPMVVVSHDRAFLDQLCTKIVETDRGVAKTWKGNYSDYLAQKQTAVTAQLAAWNRQQKELQRQTEMIHRLAGGGQAGRAEAAKKAMAKMREEGTMVEKPFIEKKRMYRFPSMGNSGRVVVRAENLTHGYGNKVLFENANLVVERGERVAFVGPNGCGKSTFLRLLLDQEKPEGGQVRLGEHKVVPNFFSQNQAETLDPERSIIETLEMSGTDKPLSELKALLGRFLFQGDKIHKKVSFLSGGEKARVALALFMVTPATLLVLDEPTNHLDIASKEMLEEAVKNFEGTVLAVSHDRYFLRQIATRVVDIKNGVFTTYEGDYQYFLESNEDAAEKDAKFQEKENEIAKSQVKAKSKMSKAEKAALKKERARQFSGGGSGKKAKNNKRWN